MTTVFYTEGACLGNPGPGGWAWAVPDGPFASGPSPATTNQRMEIQAASEAVRTLDGPLVVRSDSTYVVNCFRDRWWEGWIARGWLNKAKKPVANRDLWEPLIAAVRAQPDRVRFEWVKGHSNDVMNDLVDRLAVEAAATQVGRTGTGEPPLPGPEFGHGVVVAGHRPPELGGYGTNPVADKVRTKLAEILAAKASMHPDITVLTGLGLGAEQLGAEAAATAGVPYVAVLAFPEPDKLWPEESKRRFQALLEGAARQVVVTGKAPATKPAAGAALARRDSWAAARGAEAIVVWDGVDPVVGRQVKSFRDHLGELAVWILAP